MKIDFLWDDEKTKKFHKAQLYTYAIGGPGVTLYGYLLPENTPGRALLITLPIIVTLFGIINLIFINKGNQGWKFTFTLLLIQTVGIILMAHSGGFSSILQFATYAVLLVAVTQLGPQATFVIFVFSAFSLVAMHFWLMANAPQSTSWPDFLVYTFLYIVIAFVQFKISKEFSIQFETRKKLEQVDDLKNQFITLSSHYLRTPVTVISGYLDRLTETSLTKTQSEYVYAINKNTKELQALTQKLLVISSIERGNASLKSTKDSLNVFLSQLVKSYEEQAREKTILLKYQEAGNLVETSFDKIRLTAAVGHLIDNAIKYNKEHGTVTVSLEVLDNKALITVSDTGSGINPSEIENLFTPFNKGSMEEVLSVKGPGAGLSLYLTKLIIEAHKGTIKVESTPNQGSEFVIALPIT